MNIKQRVVNTFDTIVYRLAFKSLQRYMTRNPAIAYLFEEQLRRYRLKNPLSQSLIDSTNEFLDFFEERYCNARPEDIARCRDEIV